MAWRLVTVKQCNGSPTWQNEDLSVSESHSDGELYRWEEEPALYFLPEIVALRNLTEEQLREIHLAKLCFSGQRMVQEGVE